MSRPDPERYPLVPWPRSIVARPGQAPRGTAPSMERDARLGPEAFTLEVSEQAAGIRAGDDRGVMHARRALRRGTPRYDGTPHGGFYAQDEVRAVVAHAAARGVDCPPGDRAPGPLGGGVRRVPRARARRAAARGAHDVGPSRRRLPPGRGGVRVPRGRARRGRRALPVPLHPHRRRRSAEDEVEGVRRRAGDHPARGPARRGPPPELGDRAPSGSPAASGGGWWAGTRSSRAASPRMRP